MTVTVTEVPEQKILADLVVGAGGRFRYGVGSTITSTLSRLWHASRPSTPSCPIAIIPKPARNVNLVAEQRG